MIKRALVSVSNKEGLVDFLELVKKSGYQFVSTGGTAQYLKDHKFEVVDVATVTGFPEVLSGRVKTLHPRIHMGLLADNDNADHRNDMQDQNVEFFDLVVGNLYPFEEKRDIEHIDIGGPSFLRSAAKNFKHIIVVCDPTDYQWVSEKIHKNELNINDRKKLAAKVFELTSYYDSLIATQFFGELGLAPEKYLLNPAKLKKKLRYGENPQQTASWFENTMQQEKLSDAQFIQGKELSYNNILDLDAAIGLVSGFIGPTCVAIKHNNPCGVGFGQSIEEAVHNAIAADPKSIFGGVVAINSRLDRLSAEKLSTLFLECLIVPEATPDAIEILKQKKNLRILLWPQLIKDNRRASFNIQVRSVLGGMLVQDSDELNKDTSASWTFFGEVPNKEMLDLAKDCERICASLKSNAIAISGKMGSLGLGMGQVNRVDAVLQAIARFQSFVASNTVNMNEVILASDAFFPFSDSIEVIARAGIKWIIQPGGSVKDADVVAAAQKFNINMITTGVRHFKH